ncbi:hypothetical protein [Vibrio quintilis]|uniref:Peptidase C39-like domain-containing protein n=1 Tax=Vibrio quintilis TaxID=1117707 RepID=A0A1M7YUW2_9VIBR|nr:hypothetical protein [Vibrio quintilis]SHO56470.1 hypothetical protein VQ7734_02239 [Vibrio quintilis]
MYRHNKKIKRLATKAPLHSPARAAEMSGLRRYPVRQLSPEKMEIDQPDEAMEVDQKINPYQLTHNCYYCTAAYLAGYDDVNDMVGETGIMQQHTAPLDEIMSLFQYVGLTYNYHHSTNPADIELAKKSGKRFGLAYVRNDPGRTGHMVVIEHGRIIDTQQDHKEVDPIAEQAVEFHFFELNH